MSYTTDIVYISLSIKASQQLACCMSKCQDDLARSIRPRLNLASEWFRMPTKSQPWSTMYNSGRRTTYETRLGTHSFGGIIGRPSPSTSGLILNIDKIEAIPMKSIEVAMWRPGQSLQKCKYASVSSSHSNSVTLTFCQSQTQPEVRERLGRVYHQASTISPVWMKMALGTPLCHEE